MSLNTCLLTTLKWSFELPATLTDLYQLVSTLLTGRDLDNSAVYPSWIIIIIPLTVVQPRLYPNIASNTVLVFAAFQPPNATHLPFLLMEHPQPPTASTQQQPTPQIVHESNSPPRETVTVWRSQWESLESPPALHLTTILTPCSHRNIPTTRPSQPMGY